MHKRHYKMLAEAFAKMRASDPRDYATMSFNDIINEVEDEICFVLNHDNPSFSYKKFTDASGRRDKHGWSSNEINDGEGA